MSVRPAGPERAVDLAAAHALAFEDGWSARAVTDLLGSPGVLALEDDGGFILIRVVAGEAEVLTLAVVPEARRRGLGRALLRAAMAAAADAGATTLFLEVAADNAAAVTLYETEGFVRAGLRAGYYARAGAPGQDALVLRRALNSAGA